MMQQSRCDDIGLFVPVTSYLAVAYSWTPSMQLVLHLSDVWLVSTLLLHTPHQLLDINGKILPVCHRGDRHLQHNKFM